MQGMIGFLIFILLQIYVPAKKMKNRLGFDRIMAISLGYRFVTFLCIFETSQLLIVAYHLVINSKSI